MRVKLNAGIRDVMQACEGMIAVIAFSCKLREMYALETIGAPSRSMQSLDTTVNGIVEVRGRSQAGFVAGQKARVLREFRKN